MQPIETMNETVRVAVGTVLQCTLYTTVSTRGRTTRVQLSYNTTTVTTKFRFYYTRIWCNMRAV
ncbi:hypothetical protein J6590_003473 [Homalodisca vitripennis]|nr:hypothetical protein J6590_003473 [Homalodisca vitripennis]